MAKKKINENVSPAIQPEDTSPVNVSDLHEGKTLRVKISAQNTRPLPDGSTSLDETQGFIPLDSKMDFDSTMNINPPTKPLPEPKPRRWLWILVGILIVLLGAGIGSYIGYNAAVKARVAEQDGKVALVTTTQFQLAIVDQAEGRLDTARKRLEYIIQLNPSFPGISQKLAEVMMAQAVIATPTSAVEPTPVPTKDTRNTEELFLQARQQAANNEWNAAISTLDSLRQVDRTYRAIQVDGLYATALRNRGIARINGGQLEPGIYDITMASLYGPLDKDAIASSTTARYYLTGAAAWGVDWPKVLEFFAQFYPSAPGLRDATGMTAAERFRKGSILYGDKLMVDENPCDAAYHYQNALNVSSDESTIGKLANANNKCAPPTEKPAPTNHPEPTSDVTNPPPDATAIPVPTEVPPAEPTAVPT
jgi:hypothetical protein